MSSLYRSHHMPHEQNSHPMAIFRACMYGNLKSLKELVVAGADVNERSVSDRETPLMVAAKYGHFSSVDFLLKMDAHVNYVDSMGRTALMTACRLGEVRCVKALLYSWQVDIDKADNDGNTALILTASHFNSSEHFSCMELLIQQDADVNLKNNIGMTATMYCTNFIRWEAVKLLINAGADPEVTSDVGENLLMQVASGKNNEVLQWVIELGINDINQTNSFGDNALILSLKSGDSKCVEILLQAGSNPNSFSGQGCHSLNIAASVSFEKTLLLLTFGAVPCPSKLYVHYEISKDETDELKSAFMYCPDFFHPTDIAVLHKNFSTANLLLNVLSCKPLYCVYSNSHEHVTSHLSSLVLNHIQLAAKLCPQWLEMSQSIPSGPNRLLFLCQRVVSCMAGFSKGRRQRLNSYGLPPSLIRNILFEGLEERMFLLPQLELFEG